MTVFIAFAGCKMKGVNKDFNDALLSATSKGELSEVKKYLPSRLHEGGDLEATDGYYRTPLNKAAAKGHVEIAEYLIERGANINTKDAYGMTPLMKAADNGDLNMVKLLIAKGADINVKSLENKTALKFAIDTKRDAVVEYLKTKGATE
jgi:ankyrin repeat protein